MCCGIYIIGKSRCFCSIFSYKDVIVQYVVLEYFEGCKIILFREQVFLLVFFYVVEDESINVFFRFFVVRIRFCCNCNVVCVVIVYYVYYIVFCLVEQVFFCLMVIWMANCIEDWCDSGLNQVVVAVFRFYIVLVFQVVVCWCDVVVKCYCFIRYYGEGNFQFYF